jgi:DNA polymerase-1
LTETTGLDALHAELVGISSLTKKEKDFTCPFQKIKKRQKALIEKFIPFSKMRNEKIGQNLKYDLKILPTMILL